jgi:hypothetical protein
LEGLQEPLESAEICEMGRSKPAFHSVLDLGLRDVGMRNDPRRLAAHFGKRTPLFAALVIVCAVALCVGVRRLGADGWMVAAVGLGWIATVCAGGDRAAGAPHCG